MKEHNQKKVSEREISPLYLSVEKAHKLRGVKVVVLDVDNTIVFAKEKSFYDQYGEKVEAAIAEYFGVSDSEAKEVATFFRQHQGGGEAALFTGTAHTHFPQLAQKPVDYQLLHTLLTEIDPTGQFSTQEQIKEEIAHLRKEGIKVVAMTSSPTPLSESILRESGFDPQADFDLFVAYTPEQGPRKILDAQSAFTQVATHFNVQPHEVIAVGDSPAYDVQPALEMGMMGCLLVEGYVPDIDFTHDQLPGIMAAHVMQILSEIGTAQQFNKVREALSYENERPQILGELGTGELVLTITVATHGNEIYPVRAAQEVLKQLQGKELQRPGRVRFVANNIPALKEGRRFINADLNRIFGHEGEGSEYETAKHVLPLVQDSEFVVDIHTAPNPVDVVILPDRRADRLALGEESGFKKLVYFPGPSATSGPMVNMTRCGIGLEVGGHSHRGALETGKQVIMNYLIAKGFLTPENNELLAQQEEREQQEREYFQVVGMIPKTQGIEVAKRTPIKDFEPILATEFGMQELGEEYLYPFLVGPHREYSEMYCLVTKKITRDEVLAEKGTKK